MLGKNAVLKIGTAGGTPADEVKKVKDVNPSITKAMYDGTTRASGGWRENVPGLKEGEITFTLLGVAPADTANYAIQKTILDAFDDDTIISASAYDENGKGIMGDFYVAEAEESQPLEDLISFAVKLVPCCDTRAPVITR